MEKPILIEGLYTCSLSREQLSYIYTNNFENEQIARLAECLRCVVGELGRISYRLQNIINNQHSFPIWPIRNQMQKQDVPSTPPESMHGDEDIVSLQRIVALQEQRISAVETELFACSEHIGLQESVENLKQQIEHYTANGIRETRTLVCVIQAELKEAETKHTQMASQIQEIAEYFQNRLERLTQDMISLNNSVLNKVKWQISSVLGCVNAFKQVNYIPNVSLTNKNCSNRSAPTLVRSKKNKSSADVKTGVKVGEILASSVPRKNKKIDYNPHGSNSRVSDSSVQRETNSVADGLSSLIQIQSSSLNISRSILQKDIDIPCEDLPKCKKFNGLTDFRNISTHSECNSQNQQEFLSKTAIESNALKPSRVLNSEEVIQTTRENTSSPLVLARKVAQTSLKFRNKVLDSSKSKKIRNESSQMLPHRPNSRKQ